MRFFADIGNAIPFIKSIRDIIGGNNNAPVSDEYGDHDDADQYDQPKKKPANNDNPADTPAGNVPIDSAGLNRETVHQIEDKELRSGQK